MLKVRVIWRGVGWSPRGRSDLEGGGRKVEGKGESASCSRLVGGQGNGEVEAEEKGTF